MSAVLQASVAGGLSSGEAAARLRRDGPNVLPAPRRRHPLLVLAGQLVHFFALMLWVAAGLALVAGMPALAVAIVVVVVLNGVFSFAQESRADRAAQRLRDLLPVRATVRRDGRAVLVDAAELVVGDLMLLEAGDRRAPTCMSSSVPDWPWTTRCLPGRARRCVRGLAARCTPAPTRSRLTQPPRWSRPARRPGWPASRRSPPRPAGRAARWRPSCTGR